MAQDAKAKQSEAPTNTLQQQPEQQQADRQSQGLQGSAMPARQQQSAVARYSRHPFAMMEQLMRDMDEVFDSFFQAAPLRQRRAEQRLPNLWMPDVDMHEDGNQLKVCVDLPGIAKENVKIDVDEGALVIQGERREERSEGAEQQGFRRSERRYGSFYRTIPLPDNVDTEKAEANMKEGVLTITFPLSRAKQGRRLEIKS
jgi:HSP20 family protein